MGRFKPTPLAITAGILMVASFFASKVNEQRELEATIDERIEEWEKQKSKTNKKR